MATIPTAYQAKTYGLLNSSANTAPKIPTAPAVSTGYTATNAATAPNVKAGTATATKAVGTGYNPTLSEVNVPTDTVQGQIQSIIDKNSPLMQQAETRARQQANARGLLNSSMAVQAGQAALYDVAAPIASADADIYNTTRFNNQNMSNTASQFGASAKNQASLANAQLSTDVSKTNVDNTLKAGLINQDQANRMAQFNAESANVARQFGAASANDMAKFNVDNTSKLAIASLQNSADVAKFNASQSNDLIKLGMDSNTRTALAGIEANYKTLMQSSASASDMYKQAITSAASILANRDISDKAKALNNITAQLNEGLSIIGEIANLDLGSYLNFNNAAAPTISSSPSPSMTVAPATAMPEKLPGESPFAYGARLTQMGIALPSRPPTYDAGFGGAA